jgi:hypothetical protein
MLKRIVIFIIIVLMVGINIDELPKEFEETKDASEVDSESTLSDDDAIKLGIILYSDKWLIDEKVNEETGRKDRLAILTSSDKLFFNEPYNGGSTLSLNIRNLNNKLEIYLIIYKGEFETEEGDVEFKFENNRTLACKITRAENDYDRIFLSNEDSLVDLIKTSKSFVVEAPFYGEGRKRCKFKWEFDEEEPMVIDGELLVDL